MAKDDYRFSDEEAFRAWAATRPPGEAWRYIDGYAILIDGLWDGEHWHPAPPARPRLRERVVRLLAARARRGERGVYRDGRPDFSTPDKFLDWSARKRDDP